MVQACNVSFVHHERIPCVHVQADSLQPMMTLTKTSRRCVFTVIFIYVLDDIYLYVLPTLREKISGRRSSRKMKNQKIFLNILRRCVHWSCSLTFTFQSCFTPHSAAHLQPPQQVAAQHVVIFMKGNPKAPQCGFSNMACRILDSYGAPQALPAGTLLHPQQPLKKSAMLRVVRVPVPRQRCHTAALTCCPMLSCARG